MPAVASHFLVFVAESLSQSRIDDALRRLESDDLDVESWRWLWDGRAAEIAVAGQPQTDAYEAEGVDLALVPAEHRRKGLLVSDMDSTIIQDETIDLLAAELGLGERVAAITERAMRGEIDFQDALRERVGLLTGLAEAVLAEVPKGASLSPGAAEMVKTMRDHGAKTVLVSGGFDFMTEAVSPLVGFQETHANVLAVEQGALTGEVVGDIVDGDTKLAVLQAETTGLALDPAQTLAIGDGANDLKMIQASGMGIAYHAKPIVEQQADFHIRYTDLRTALFYQGYHRDEISR